jgi:hypothetical protein
VWICRRGRMRSGGTCVRCDEPNVIENAKAAKLAKPN